MLYGLGQNLAIVFLFWSMPQTSIFYFSISGLSENWKYAFTVIEVYPYWISWMNGVPCLHLVMMLTSSASFWLRQCQLPRDPEEDKKLTRRPISCNTSDTLRRRQNVFATYRKIQMIVARYNTYMNFTAMVGQKIASMLMVVVALYGSIRFYSSMKFLAYVAFPIVSVSCVVYIRIAYSRGGVLNADAEMFRRSWRYRTPRPIPLVKRQKQESRNKEKLGKLVTPISVENQIQESIMDSQVYVNRYLKSCCDPKISMGGFYNFEKTTAVTFLDIAFEYAVTLLLTF